MIVYHLTIILAVAFFFTALAVWRRSVVAGILSAIAWMASGLGSIAVEVPRGPGLYYSGQGNETTTTIAYDTAVPYFLIFVGLVMVIVSLLWVFRGEESAS